MPKIFQCSYCDKTFANRHNLSRHRRTFHLKSIHADRSSSQREIERGNGLIMDYTPGYGVGASTKSSRETDSTNSTDDEHTNSEAETEPATEESDNNDASCSEVDHSINNWLWEKLVIMCCTKELKQLDMLKGYILSYIESEFDKLFQDIMSDIVIAELREMSPRDAIEYAINKNEGLIIASVNKCEENSGDESLWCRLADVGGKWNCHWFTGKACYCEDCDGASILTTVRVYIELFIAMQEDGLMQQILADVVEMGEEMALEDAIDLTVTRYEKDILAKFQDAENVVNACDWDKTRFF